MPRQPPLKASQLTQEGNIMKEVDGRHLWLQESILSAASFTAAIDLVARRRELSRKEKDMENVALAFMYLYNVVEEQGLLTEVDSFFTTETIH